MPSILSIYLFLQAERAIEEQITKLAAKRKEKGCEFLGLNLDTERMSINRVARDSQRSKAMSLKYSPPQTDQAVAVVHPTTRVAIE
eukprot:scaffold10103_cov59-Phaeocystis_antarctica.AAC.10